MLTEEKIQQISTSSYLLLLETHSFFLSVVTFLLTSDKVVLGVHGLLSVFPLLASMLSWSVKVIIGLRAIDKS